MHEAAIAAPLLRLVLEETEKQAAVSGPLAVSHIRIKAGLLMAIEPLTLQGCFALMAEGTAAEGAALEVENVPMQGHCDACGQDVVTGARTFGCPVCMSAEVSWSGGNELFIDSLQVKPLDSAPAATK
jgi:hydrogenase nickel incorporation protein HypA/HybF